MISRLTKIAAVGALVGALALPAAAQIVPTECATGVASIDQCGLSQLINVGVTVARYIFGISGSVALIFFIYGGFLWLTSGGSPEKVKQGKDVLIGSVIGLIIIFGAVTLVNFLSTALRPPTAAEKAAEKAPEPGAAGACLCACEGAACDRVDVARAETACTNRGCVWSAGDVKCSCPRGVINEAECTGPVQSELAAAGLSCAFAPAP